jgi:hypothetical protein
MSFDRPGPGAPETREPVKVLYLAGSGRSGTTVISNILGQLPGVFAAGELRYLWQRGLVEDRLCGCGAPFGSCPIWSGVLHDVFADVGTADGGAVADRLRTRLRLLRVPVMLARRRAGRRAIPAHADDAVLQRLYTTLVEHTGDSVVVDSSKLPPYGLLLDQLSGIELYVLHVVRDPRATAFSWLRKKQLLDFGDDQLMPQQGLLKSSVLWLSWNSLTALLWGSSRDRYLRVRYEDFVAAPEQTMARVVRLIGLDPADLPFETPTSVRLGVTHSVAGNPARLTTGAVPLKPDVEWASTMPARDRMLVTALTGPALVRFGYSPSVRSA